MRDEPLSGVGGRLMRNSKSGGFFLQLRSSNGTFTRFTLSQPLKLIDLLPYLGRLTIRITSSTETERERERWLDISSSDFYSPRKAFALEWSDSAMLLYCFRKTSQAYTSFMIIPFLLRPLSMVKRSESSLPALSKTYCARFIYQQRDNARCLVIRLVQRCESDTKDYVVETTSSLVGTGK